MQTLTQRATIMFVLGIALALFALTIPRPTHAAAALVVSTATSTSNNASTTLATTANTVSFQLNANGNVWTAPQISVLNMGTTTMSGSNANWTYSTTSVSGWTEGNVTFFISFGNTDGTATTTFASSASTTFTHVVFDKTAPTLTSVAVASSNTSPTLAKIGDVITLSIQASASDLSASNSTITILGHTANVVATTTPNRFITASTTVQSGDASGAVSFSITPKDPAGNASSTPQTAPNSGSVTVYGSVPTVTVTGANPDTTSVNGSVNYSDQGATATDALSVTLSVTTSGSVDRTTAGSYTLTYSATDSAGNTNSATRTVTVGGTGGGGPIVGSIGGVGSGSLIPTAPGTLPINQLSAPGTAPSGNLSGNAALIASLQAQLATLMAQIAAMGGSAGGSFTRDLTVGSTGSDVMQLQVWLNGHGFEIAKSGAGSPGNETSKFGALTRAALAKWQASVGISPAAGFFGSKTRAYLAAHQ